jgi:hypothetical protein
MRERLARWRSEVGAKLPQPKPIQSESKAKARR